MSHTHIDHGVVVLPLNIPGPDYAGLTLTYDFKELVGSGGFGEAWRTLSRGTGDWHEHATKVSVEPRAHDRIRRALHRTMAVAALLPHPHLCDVDCVSERSGRLWVDSKLAEGNMANLAAGTARLPELVRY